MVERALLHGRVRVRPRSVLLRVTPHGRPDAAQGVQPGSGTSRRNAQLHWAMRGQDPLLIGYFFLKRLSNARRASSGRADPDVVLRSTATCSEKNVQALRTHLSAMRSGTG